jgi:hypothetical protein
MPKNARESESPVRLLARFVTNSGTWEKQSLALAAYWTKLVLSITMGIIAGFAGLSGIVAHMFYALTCHLSVHLYATYQLGLEIESLFDSASALLTEGLMQSYAGFVLAWSAVATIRYGLH